jgi:hypothetical protein
LIAFNLNRSRHDEVPSGLIGRVDRDLHERNTFEENPADKLGQDVVTMETHLIDWIVFEYTISL